ncbi:MAG: hypothetical protein RL522_59 [Pseudomonadota bacterium]
MIGLKHIGLCADDFGLKPEINEAVVQLVDAGVITAVSCMSTAPAWLSGAQGLRGLRRAKVDVGVHINLTEVQAADPGHLRMPLAQVIACSLLHLLSGRALHQAIHQQLSTFEDAFQEPPDFVDGHQHVHQLPQVRDALMQCLAQRYPQHRPWLRCTRASRVLPIPFKQRVIAQLGAATWMRRALQRGYPMNRHLLGVYGFDADLPRYTALLATWLEACQNGDLLTLHPAVPSATHPRGGRDPIAVARVVEYQALRRDGPQLLSHYGVTPVRLSRHPEWLRH